jgi:mannose-6-phosphate isomerase-like protein (cupin superfamily)
MARLRPRPRAATIRGMAPLSTRPRTVSYGAALTFETLLEGEPAPDRLRPDEDSLLRVLGGLVRLTVDGEERLLGTGDEAIVAAGARHRLASASGEARVLAGFRRR